MSNELLFTFEKQIHNYSHQKYWDDTQRLFNLINPM